MIDGYGFFKVLMDGGSNINILYVETQQRMKLSTAQLKHSNVVFHGVVPGRQGQSLGSITLDVAFGTPENYRLEILTFEVAPFKSAYPAIFGRPAFAAFMARSCYIYNKLKIPGPNGVMTTESNIKKARECEVGAAAFAKDVLNTDEYKQMVKDVDPKELPATKK
jgi:hypothetical protein